MFSSNFLTADTTGTSDATYLTTEWKELVGHTTESTIVTESSCPCTPGG